MALERASSHIKVTPSLLIPVAAMGKCKQINNTTLFTVRDVILLIIDEINYARDAMLPENTNVTGRISERMGHGPGRY